MEFNPNFTYMLQSATAEDNVYHKDLNSLFLNSISFTYFFLQPSELNYTFSFVNNNNKLFSSDFLFVKLYC
jgi:hypothetical protein